MIDVPRQTLREIVAKYGRSVCENPKRCKALLRDYCGTYRREINVLVAALEERVGVRRTPRDASNLGAAIQTYMRAHVLATRSEMAAVLGVDRTLVSRVGACGCAGLATL